jgi:hypothetical protein
MCTARADISVGDKRPAGLMREAAAQQCTVISIVGTELRQSCCTILPAATKLLVVVGTGPIGCCRRQLSVGNQAAVYQDVMAAEAAFAGNDKRITGAGLEAAGSRRCYNMLPQGVQD